MQSHRISNEGESIALGQCSTGGEGALPHLTFGAERGKRADTNDHEFGEKHARARSVAATDGVTAQRSAAGTARATVAPTMPVRRFRSAGAQS
jgi:hypothetical protein